MLGLQLCAYIIIVWISMVNAVISTMNDQEKKQMLDAHNKYRGEVQPNAVSMLMMNWNEDLANYAQEKADKCLYKHGERFIVPTYGKLGENLFITSGRMPAPDLGIDQSVKMWDEEKHFYNYSTNLCNPGKDCGHYTQVVWHDSNLVGCGMKYCTVPVKVTETRTLSTSTIIFCEYAPTGNKQAAFFFNLKPERPFKKGTPCSSCSSGANICINNLCATKKQETAHNKASSQTTKPTTTTTTTKPTTTTLTTKSTTTTTTKKEELPVTKPEDAKTTSTKKDENKKDDDRKKEDKEKDIDLISTRSFEPKHENLTCKSCAENMNTKACLESKEEKLCESDTSVCIISASLTTAFAGCMKEYDCDTRKEMSNSSTLVKCCYTDLCNTFNTSSLNTDSGTQPGGNANINHSPKINMILVVLYLTLFLFF